MKERIRSILFVFALALVFVGAAKVTEAAAAEAPEKYSINYDEETVTLSAVSGSVYYQVIKADDKTQAKAANWLPVAKDDNAFVIDISALPNNKGSFIAVGFSAKQDKDCEYIVEIPALVKSVKASLDYMVEDVEAASGSGIYAVISKLTVTDSTGKKIEWDAADSTCKLSEVVKLGWKRGANGDWQDDAAFTTFQWEMMKSSNTTLYLRAEEVDVDGANGLDDTRYSKEVKVKIPKTAKAPKIKVDYKKGTVAIKSGMEIKVGGKWVAIAVKDGAATNETDPFAKTIKKGVSSLTLDQLKEKIGFENGEAVTIEVRTAANTKKFASYVAEVSFTAPLDAPKLKTGATAEKVLVVTVSGSAITAAKLDFAAAVEGIDATYEYAFVGENCDLAKQTFTKVPVKNGKTELDLTSKLKSNNPVVKYSKIGSTSKVDVRYTEATLLIRKAAVTRDDLAFASDILTIDLKKADAE